jgi:hypothetical protein
MSGPPARPEGRGKGAGAILRSTLLLLARALLSGSILFFLFYLSIDATRRWRDDAYWRRFPPDFGCDDTKLLDACTARAVVASLYAPATATLAATFLTAAAATLLPHLPSASGLSNRLRLDSQRQLPPSSFWSWWCGGFSAQDAALVAGALLINGAWALSLGSRYARLFKYFSGSGSGTPTWALEAMLAAIALGQMLFPNLALLFFPVARGSPLLSAVGLSYPSAVRFHRWLGHWTMALASAHSIGFWGVWLARGMWLKEALARGSRVNNLAGGLSFLGGLALWLTSVEWARRANYGLFIAAHHLGWWLFFLAGAAHYSPIVWWFAPGLVLYFADAAFRVWSNSGNGNGGGGGNSGGGAGGSGKSGRGNVLALEVAWEEGAEVEEEQQASVVAVVVRAPRGFAAADAGIVWARCPQLSRWQWHPFEYLLVQGQGKEGGEDSAVLAMHVKSYGRWSRRFARLAREAALSGPVQRLDLWLEAPYGDGPPAASSSSSSSSSSPIVVLAGGIGATAALSLLRELEREHGEEEQGNNPPHRRRRPMLFVWTSRHAPELALLLPRLIDAAERAGVDLDARLFFTGRGGVAALAAPGAWASAASAAAAAASSSSSPLLHLPTPPAEVASSQCPVLAPGRWLFQLAQRLSAHLLAFAGATAALLLVRQWSVVAPARGDGGDGWTTAQAGLASAVGLALGAGLPALAVIAAARAVVGVVFGGSAREGGGAASKEEGALRRPLLDSATAATTGAATSTAGGGLASRVRFVPAASGGALAVVAPPPTSINGGGNAAGPLAELPLSLGRPASLRAMVGDWLAAVKDSDGDDGAAAPPAELFAMGPEALVAEARALCSGSGNGGKLLFRLRTHEL